MEMRLRVYYMDYQLSLRFRLSRLSMRFRLSRLSVNRLIHLGFVGEYPYHGCITHLVCSPYIETSWIHRLMIRLLYIIFSHIHNNDNFSHIDIEVNCWCYESHTLVSRLSIYLICILLIRRLTNDVTTYLL